MTARKSSPVIVLFHGSRHPEANTKARVLAKKISASLPGRNIETAFLSQAFPRLSEALQKLASDNHRRITVLPVFFFNGVHMTKDIPAAVKEATAEFPALDVTVAPVLGPSDELALLFVNRLDEAETAL